MFSDIKGLWDVVRGLFVEVEKTSAGSTVTASVFNANGFSSNDFGVFGSSNDFGVFSGVVYTFGSNDS